MRLAILADIHGNLAALEAVTADIHRRGVDQIVNLGDSLSGPLLPLEAAQYLMAADWLTIAGNHERQLLSDGPEPRNASDEYTHSRLTDREFAWLRSLPPSTSLSAGLFLCHGTPSSDREYLLETVEAGAVRPATSKEIEERLGSELSPVVACGHSHIARFARTIARTARDSRGQLIINPGSVGLPAYDDDDPVPHVVETGSPDARYAIIEGPGDGWFVSLLSVPYDHGSMAREAARRGRRDWEHALLTGYMP